MKKSTCFAALAVVIAVHLAAFAWLIGRFECVVTDGTECRFPCTAYDPADPFRGRYLRMNVEVQLPISHEMATNYWRKGEWSRKCPLAVKIDPAGGADGLSRVVDIAERPKDDGLWVNECPVSHARGTKDIARIRFPDRYFLNENLAEGGERLLQLSATNCVAVYRVRDGSIVLTGIEVNGRRIEDAIREMGPLLAR